MFCLRTLILQSSRYKETDMMHAIPTTVERLAFLTIIPPIQKTADEEGGTGTKHRRVKEGRVKDIVHLLQLHARPLPAATVIAAVFGAFWTSSG
jgi:hypothetical protein